MSARPNQTARLVTNARHCIKRRSVVRYRSERGTNEPVLPPAVHRPQPTNAHNPDNGTTGGSTSGQRPSGNCFNVSPPGVHVTSPLKQCSRVLSGNRRRQIQSTTVQPIKAVQGPGRSMVRQWEGCRHNVTGSTRLASTPGLYWGYRDQRRPPPNGEPCSPARRPVNVVSRGACQFSLNVVGLATVVGTPRSPPRNASFRIITINHNRPNAATAWLAQFVQHQRQRKPQGTAPSTTNWATSGNWHGP
jgi:hypothetical protein